MRQYRITLLPENRVIETDGDRTLAEILADEGIPVPVPCGGKGICGRCRVEASGALSAPTEREIAAALPGGTRFACQVRPAGDCRIIASSLAAEPVPVTVPSRLKGEFALAVDIGTTTIKASLVHLETGDAFPFAPWFNPQRRFGHDVISRIAASAEPDQHRQLVSLLRGEIARIVGLSRRAAPGPLVKMAVSGNTVMTYYLLDREVRTLGVAPYAADLRDFEGFTTAGMDLGFEKPVPLLVNPVASAFLGGDLVGGLALADGRGQSRGVFFIDLGTNGEMFLRTPVGTAYAASCAMGPALEGMNIAYGMTATEGAITHVRAEGRSVQLEIMGGSEPAGISGTGIIDLLALLLRLKAVDATGLLARDRLQELAKEYDGLQWLSEERAVALGPVRFTQKDIRSVQLAKGASLAASRLLLRESGCTPDDVRTVLIAGSFGENLDTANFKRLSFIPDFPAAEYRYLGNTSLSSAELSCRDREFPARMKLLRDRIHVLELNALPGFNDLYMDSLSF